MNKKQMSEALAAEYEAWLAGKAQPSTLFKPPAPKRPSPVTPKPPKPPVKTKPAKPPRIKKPKVLKRPPPVMPISDAILQVLTEPTKSTVVAQIVAEKLQVNQISVLNVIAQMIKRGDLISNSHKKGVTVIGRQQFSIAEIERQDYAAHYKDLIVLVGEGGTQAQIARRANCTASDLSYKLKRLVELGILRRERFLYRVVA